MGKEQKLFKRLENGLTGYPIVDAGMRELYSTGWMHNRVRMIVGSFLVKHLLINWSEGEKFFKNCLLDIMNKQCFWMAVVAGSAQMLLLILGYLTLFSKGKI